MDSAGVALLRSLARLCRRRGVRLRIQSIDPSIQHFLDYLDRGAPVVQVQPAPPDGSPKARFGSFLMGQAVELKQFVGFCSSFFSVAARSVRHPRRFRSRESFYYFQLAGSEAMTILFLITFLLGVVMAFQAAIQLKQLGANIYAANLVSLALARELASVFTAMLLAGRSGSFFAAEIGTMKVGEELDAIAVMGFD